MQSEKVKNGDGENGVDVITKLNEYVKSIAKKEGYITYDFERKHVSSGGGSYMGTLYSIDIKGRTEDGDKETNIFMKHIVQIQQQIIFDVAEVYKRENFVYTDLIKEMYDLQEKENVPMEERYKPAKAFDESNEETIILENLKVKGFKTYYRMDVINLEYAELAIKNLARLHGLSIALEIKRPDYFEKIKDMDCLYIFKENWDGFTQNMFSFVEQFLTDDLGKTVAKRLVDIVAKYPSYMTDTSCVRTICHGDFRPNNIMVKEIDGKPTEVIVLDYQIAYIGNPVLDFIYFIFWGTDQEFRKNHLDHLAQLYHRYLGTFLTHFNIEVEDVFPKNEFERQYRDKLDFGLMISVLYLPFLFPPENDVVDLVNLKEPSKEMSVKVDPKYGERLRGIIDDFVAWGYL